MNPSYIATNLEELFDQSPQEIRQLIIGNEVNDTTAILGKLYKIPVSSYIALSNIISYILIGGLKPEDVVHALQEILKLSEEEALKLAKDLDKTILEKARIKILGKPAGELVTLEFEKGVSQDELRKEILDTTKRESALTKDQSAQSSPEEKKTTQSIEPTPSISPFKDPSAPRRQVILTPGSRSQLLEQLQVIGSIPNDEEIEARLSHIKDQIANLDKKEEPHEEIISDIPSPRAFDLNEKGDSVVTAESHQASYSKAPTKYNVDPYRELAER